jgi:hypothetical protein
LWDAHNNLESLVLRQGNVLVDQQQLLNGFTDHLPGLVELGDQVTALHRDLSFTITEFGGRLDGLRPASPIPSSSSGTGHHRHPLVTPPGSYPTTSSPPIEDARIFLSASDFDSPVPSGNVSIPGTQDSYWFEDSAEDRDEEEEVVRAVASTEALWGEGTSRGQRARRGGRRDGGSSSGRWSYHTALAQQLMTGELVLGQELGEDGEEGGSILDDAGLEALMS